MFANFANPVGNDDDQMIRNLAITISNLTGANGSRETGLNNIIAAAAGVPAAPMSVPQPAAISANRPQNNSKNKKVTKTITTATTKTTVVKAKSIVAKSKTTLAETTPAALVNGKLPQLSTRRMVLNAIRTLDEPGGSSLRHIKKFIYDHYDVDQRRVNIFIRKYLRKAYSEGELVQKRGKPFNVGRKFQISPK